MIPQRMPPAAAPIRPPLPLSWLVEAPSTAPAAAPIAASRCVWRTGSRGVLGYEPPLGEEPPSPRLARDEARDVRRTGARARDTGARPAVLYCGACARVAPCWSSLGDTNCCA